MSSYYDKIINSNKVGRHSKRLVSLDDSLAQEDKPDVFNISQSKPQLITTDKKKPQTKQKQIVIKNSGDATKAKQNKQQKIQNSNNKKISKSQKKQSVKKIDGHQEQGFQNHALQQVNSEEGEVHGIGKKSWLSLPQSLSLSLGHFSYPYKFPIRRQIPIIANNLDLQRQKYENGTYISQSFNNNLEVSFLLFFIRTVLVESIARISIILWITAIVLSYIIPSYEQYRPEKQIILGIFIFYLIIGIVFQYLAIKDRRKLLQNSHVCKYKVYHFDHQHKTAQWILTDAVDLRPGNIYKIPISTPQAKAVLPTDSIFLHASRTIIQVDESQIIEYLSPIEKQQRISLKQALMKQQIMKLPITGVIHYELAASEILKQNIMGKFMLQQPTQQTFSISYNNVLLRGTSMISQQMFNNDESSKIQEKDIEVLAVVLQTGIDSLVLKSSQYPYQYRDYYTIMRIADIVGIICSVFYLLVIGSGILIGYIYQANGSISRGYYIDTYLQAGQTPVTLAKTVFYHFSNLIIIVPISLRIICLIYVNIAGRIIQTDLGVKFKDYNMISEIREAQILVTTIGGDLIKMGYNKFEDNVQDQVPNNVFQSTNQITKPLIKNRSLQSVRVGSIHHNFLTTSIENQLYSTKDVDVICYFMSIALLTCNRQNPSPLQAAIIERCNKQLNIKVQKFNNNSIKIGQLRVTKIFIIPPTENSPYKLVFYKHAKQVQDLEKQESKQKILCLVRGQTTQITKKIDQTEGTLLNQFSTRISQQKGYHVQLLGKFVLSVEDFTEIKRAYLSSKFKNENMLNQEPSEKSYRYGIESFYSGLDKYMIKIDPMGLLIWENPYSILSDNLLPLSSLSLPEYKIIIAPASKSQTNPEYKSIHTITNYLLRTQNLSLKQISSKIMHNYTNKEAFWSQLKSEKILVLNGWQNQSIKKMLRQIKNSPLQSKRQSRILAYIQQDQYAWVLKQSDFSISCEGNGYDLQKYADVIIKSKTLAPTTATVKNLFSYSQAYNYCISSLIKIQLMKSLIIASVQFINLFYTWGTGLAVISMPLYLILQLALFFDFVYYLFPTPDEQVCIIQKTKNKKERRKQLKNQFTPQAMIVDMAMAILIGGFLTLISIYSMTQPTSVSGTVQPKTFTNVLIYFILHHSLVLRKIFMEPYSVSIVKIAIIIFQCSVFYIGLLVVSAVDYYHYKGIIWYVIQPKIIIIGVFSVWIIISIYWLYFMITNLYNSMHNKKKNKYNKVLKKEEEVAVTQRKVGVPVDIQ